ncbi:hypothetical protein AB3G45_14410 [Shinella sp. S4-D37]|uniref:hypothetical protein n=1 Tax=Shinella sp. S4-D37 TaxID=3161999 RepID=UPI003466A56B
MGIIGTLRDHWIRFRRRQAEREALRLLLARRDARLLRDAGLALTEDGAGGCEALPRVKERHWTAPLIRLRPPSRKRGEGDVAPALHGTREKPAA